MVMPGAVMRGGYVIAWSLACRLVNNYELARIDVSSPGDETHPEVREGN